MKAKIRIVGPILMAVLMVFALMPLSAEPAYAAWSMTDNNGVTYMLYSNNKQATVSGHTDNLSSTITIPSSVTYNSMQFKVTSIGNDAFSSCNSLTSITIPANVTSIGNSAFKDCKSLETITIPESVTSIGNSAFKDCKSLETITIPASVTSIGTDVFSASGLKSIEFASGSVLQSIGNFTFKGCKSLETITFPESVTSIGDLAFSDCASLETITFPASVTSIGKYAFSSCTKLKTITIPESVTFIGLYAFAEAPLTAVNFGGTEEQWAAITGDGKPINVPVNFGAFTVTFLDGQGNTLKTETVKKGEDATAPDVPTREGFTFDSWDPEDFSNITSNLTVTALWRKLVNIKNVNINIEAPECGTEVQLVEYADGDGQYSGRSPHTHPWPIVTVSSDEVNIINDPYHGGSEVTGIWTDNEQGVITWETPNSGYFTGTMEGGKEYYARFSLDAVGDYIFGNNRYDVIKVNGQKPVYVSNDSDTHVVVVAKVKASHVLASETIVKATPGINGSINRTCEKCGKDYSEAISAPTDFLLSKTSYTYSGAKNIPSVTVKDADGKIIDPSNYNVTYEDNINAGTATATVTFKGDYFEGSKTLTFNITKAANPLTMKPKTAMVKFSKLKKMAQPLAVTKVITFTKQLKDKKTYTLVSAKKGSKSFKKYFKINKTTGKVTIKKNKKMKKGTYKVRVKIQALGNSNYNASAVKTMTFKVKVK